MSHSNTQRLTDYWRARRGADLAPLRSRFDPADFADLLPQVFILGRPAAGRYVFRLCGALLEDLHGRDLRQTEFLPLWESPSRLQLQLAVETALRRGQAMVVDAEGRSAEGRAATVEILLAPMISHTGQADRLLGLCQPTTSLSRLLGRPLERLSIASIQPLPLIAGSPARALPPLRLAAVDGRRMA